jgi:hypothetical protein
MVFDVVTFLPSTSYPKSIIPLALLRGWASRVGFSLAMRRCWIRSSLLAWLDIMVSQTA